MPGIESLLTSIKMLETALWMLMCTWIIQYFLSTCECHNTITIRIVHVVNLKKDYHTAPKFFTSQHKLCKRKRSFEQHPLMVQSSLNCMPTLYFSLFLTLNALEHIFSAGNDYMLNGIRLTLFSMASFLVGEICSSSLTEFRQDILSGCQVCDWISIQYHQYRTYSGSWGLVVVWLS